MTPPYPLRKGESIDRRGRSCPVVYAHTCALTPTFRFPQEYRRWRTAQ